MNITMKTFLHITFILACFYLSVNVANCGPVKELSNGLSKQAHECVLLTTFLNNLNAYKIIRSREYMINARRNLMDYLEYCRKNNIIPDLVEIDFATMDLSGIDLTNAALIKSTFIGTNLKDTNISEAFALDDAEFISRGLPKHLVDSLVKKGAIFIDVPRETFIKNPRRTGI
jgi:uncharacterized protein YjbI with pentapeptide repeats